LDIPSHVLWNFLYIKIMYIHPVIALFWSPTYISLVYRIEGSLSRYRQWIKRNKLIAT
jgi:hypothetical protein